MKQTSENALEIAIKNYSSYGKYVAMGRAYPNIKDGCKSAYKRAIYGMYKEGNGNIVKCAKLASYALPYHPHPSSISGVIVQLGNDGNKLKLMKTQGNWGNSRMKISASADRYIGGALSELAEKLLCDSVKYARMIRGEIDEYEPVALPALLPLCFINGSNGIPSGLPILNIPTIDITDMINYYIEILKNKSLDYKPSWYPKPNLELDIISTKKDWNSLMESGKGSIRVAPVMSIENGVITILNMPSSKTIDSIYQILSNEINSDKINVRDESTSNIKVVIEKVPRKQCNMNEIYQRLYKKLQSSISYNMAFFDEEKIYVPCGFHKVVIENLKYLIETHDNRIKIQIDNLNNKLLVLQIIEKMKKNKDVIKLASMNNQEAIKFIIDKYKVQDVTAKEVLQKPISYLTKEHGDELERLSNSISELNRDREDIYDFLLRKYKDLKKYINPIIKNKYLKSNFVKQVKNLE